MLSTNIYFVAKRLWLICEIGTLIFFAAPNFAYATVIIGYLGEDFVIVGSDSRESDTNGRVMDDDICKITVLDNSTVFTLEGLATYKEPGIDMKQLALDTFANSTTDIDAVASKFADAAVAVLNKIPVEKRDDAIRPGHMVGMYDFLGVRKGGPQWTNINIFNKDGIFIHGDPVDHVKIHKVVVFGYFDVVTNLLRSDDYKRILDGDGNAEDKAAAGIEYLINGVIRSGVRGTTGGIASVLIVGSKGLRWSRKANECADLN